MATTASHQPSLNGEAVAANSSTDSLKAHATAGLDANESNDSSPSPEPHDVDEKPAAPVQKRRRVTRACDECRRKKIKCDGKQPCTHCTVYSYECTYDQPSNRRRNPAPQYIEALEQRLQKAESIIRTVLPGVDVDDPKFDAHGVDQIIEASRAGQSHEAGLEAKSDDDTQMRSMVDRTGSLDLDDSGNWDYHGQSSGYMFIHRFRTKFGTQLLPNTKASDGRLLNSVIDSPKSMHSSSFDVNTPLLSDLPSKEVAIECCRAALDDACALTRPLHRPKFFQRLNTLYATDVEQWTTEQYRFLPLLYAVMAVGCLFTHDDGATLDQKGYQGAIERGYYWFNISKSSVDITDCRDILAVQTVIFMIFFLQGSAKLATCYSYVGIALRACCRLGMHRNVRANFNPIEQEERKRAFWLVRKLDTYVGTMLGLPQMLSDEDIDQDAPVEVHDDYIQEHAILAMPPEIFPLIKATNAHTRLMYILKKVLKFVYPLGPPESKQGADLTVTIRHSRIRELEKDLQQWMDDLPVQLRPSENADRELSRVQQLLRMTYAYVQITLYRPFLHYVSPSCQSGEIDKRSFACAAACVSVARNIVHITSEMRRRGLLGGAYWFVMYITYFAILSLVYFVLENPDSTAAKDILRDAREGHETLASLARRSFAADRCTQSLDQLFDDLPEKLKERRSSLQVAPNVSKKRSQPSETTRASHLPAVAVPRSAPITGTFGSPNRARTIPHDYLNRAMKRSSLPNSPATTATSFSTGVDSKSQGVASSFGDGTPNAPPRPTGPLDWSMPQMQQGNFPDLQTVMFPSENPFAYGNQPISTLENSVFGGLQDVPFGSGPRHNKSDHSLPSPASLTGHTVPVQGADLELPGYPAFGDQYQGLLGDHGLGQPLTVDSPTNVQGVPRATTTGHSPFPAFAPSMQHQPEAYWNQSQPLQKTPSRPGFGQNAHGVNLDELFGGGNGWGPMNMALDIHGLDGEPETMSGLHSQGQQQQQQQQHRLGSPWGDAWS